MAADLTNAGHIVRSSIKEIAHAEGVTDTTSASRTFVGFQRTEPGAIGDAAMIASDV
jgi:hypothetical protein